MPAVTASGQTAPPTSPPRDPSAEDADLRGSHGTHLAWALAGYLALFVALTWPLVLSPAHHIVANHGDGFVDMLLFWYARQGMLLAPHVDTLFFPWGVALGPEKGFWLVPLLSVPLQWVMPIPMAFNLLGLLFFVGTGASTYLLSRECGAPRAGAFTAGALLLLSPAYLNEMAQGILENMGMQWMILYLLCGMRLRQGPSLRMSLTAGALFVLTWLGSWYLGILALLFTPLLPWRRLAPVLLVGCLLVAGQVTYAVRGGVGRPGPRYDPVVVRQFLDHQIPMEEEKWRHVGISPQRVRFDASIKVLHDSADFSRMTQRYWLEIMNDVLPTFLLLGMALLGWWRAPRAARGWGVAALLLLYLSLGPYLIWKGQAVLPLFSAQIYEWFPTLAALRPVRYLLGATFALSLVAGFGLPRLRSALVTAALVAALVGAQAVEAMVVHVAHYRPRLASTDVPAWYRQLAREEGREALIEIPFTSFSLQHGQRLYYQSVHHRPLLNYDFIREATQLELLEKVDANSVLGVIEGITTRVRRADAESLRAMGFRYLVLHTRVPRGEGSRKEYTLFSGITWHALRGMCGDPLDAGDGILVFDLQKMQDSCWNEAGTMEATRGLTEITPDRPMPIDSSETRVLGSVPAEAAFGEITGWLSGRGLELSAWQGETCVSRASCTDDDWHWIRLPLPFQQWKITALDPSVPVQVRVTASPTTTRGAVRGLLFRR